MKLRSAIDEQRRDPSVTIASRTGEGPGATLEAALDTALARACQAADADALVGTLAGPRRNRVRHTQPVDAEVIDALCRQIAAAPDGAIDATDDAARGWMGFRYGLGPAGTAFAMVAATDLDELAATRLEAVTLDLARTALVDEERSRRDQLDHLLVTARRVAESLELDTVLASIVEDATTLLGADSGDMLLWDRDRGVLRVVAVSNFPPEMLGFELAFGEGISSQAILACRPIEVDEYGTYEHRARALDRYDFGAVLCAPLVFRRVAIGALNVHARAGGHGFPPGAADLLAAFAGHAAIAIDHARRYESEVRLRGTLAETNRDLTRSLTVQQGLAEQVLLDAGPAGIASVLAEHLGRCVVIQDHLHRLIAGAAPDGGEDWRRLVPDPQIPAGGPGSGREPFTIAVRVGREVAGHLLLSSEDDLGPIDRALVDVATTGVALEFAKERAAAEVEERLRGEAATDLLAGTYPSEAAIGARAARLGYDLDEPRDLLVFDVAASGDGTDPGPLADHDGPHRWLRSVRERLAARSPRSLALAHAGTIVVLAAATRGTGSDARGVAEDLKACLEGAVGSGQVTVVIGDRCRRPDDYAPAFRLARDAADLMVKLGRGGTVIAASELGPYGLLLRASSREELESFARRTLNPLVEHDRAHAGELVSTLRAYLDEDRVQRRVAARCFIHVNTVVYRVRRIEELLGVDLGDPAIVFDLTLALRILDFLGDPAPTARTGPA
ncbi:MAG TPA: helix-turn-helix domain-containing protein [Candidatus Limnocylindrales bacterium]